MCQCYKSGLETRRSYLVPFFSTHIQDMLIPVHKIKLGVSEENGTTIRPIIVKHVDTWTVRFRQKMRGKSKRSKPVLEKIEMIHFLVKIWNHLHEPVIHDFVSLTNLQADDIRRVSHYFIKNSESTPWPIQSFSWTLDKIITLGSQSYNKVYKTHKF